MFHIVLLLIFLISMCSFYSKQFFVFLPIQLFGMSIIFIFFFLIMFSSKFWLCYIGKHWILLIKNMTDWIFFVVVTGFQSVILLDIWFLFLFSPTVECGSYSLNIISEISKHSTFSAVYLYIFPSFLLPSLLNGFCGGSCNEMLLVKSHGSYS